MLSHIVLIRLKDTVSERQTEEFLETARAMLGSIPAVRKLRVGRGLGVKAETDHPLALLMEFEDEKALESYQVHPSHRRFVEEVVGPIQDEKKVYDYAC